MAIRLLKKLTQWVAGEQVLATDLNETFSAMVQQSASLLCGVNVAKNDALVGSASVQSTPISFDAKSGGGAVNVNSITFSHVIANNSNRVLIVAVGTVGGTNSTTAVSYGGVAMTKIQDIAGTNNGRGVAGSVSLWKLVAPAVGTANIVVSNGSGGTLSAVAYSFYNVEQTSGVDVSGGTTSNGSYSLTTTSLADVFVSFSTNFAGSGSPTTMNDTTFGGVSAVSKDNSLSYGGSYYGVWGAYSPVALTQGATTIAPSYADSSYLTASVGCALKPVQAPSFGVVKSNASSTNKIGFVGFASANASAGANVDVLHTGVVGGFTGLTAGSIYYLTNTDGQIGTTAGTNSKKIGVAISSTEILVNYQN